MTRDEFLENVDFLHDCGECSYFCFKNSGDENEQLRDDLVKELIESWGCDFQTYLKALGKNRNRWKRASRVYQRTKDLVTGGNAVFLTLTFTDEVFKTTSCETRRKYVRRFLKEQALKNGCYDFVANIDFGSSNDYIGSDGIKRKATKREHYHAIIGFSCDLKAWKYGYSLAERIHSKNLDAKKTAKYVTKLSCHAIKKSTGRAYRVIYSRKDFFPIAFDPITQAV